MLIEIPVWIAFNADSAESAFRGGSGNIFGSRFTLRFDPVDTDVNPTYAPVYPPRPTTQFYPFEPQTILEFLPRHSDKQILNLADRDPEGYFVDKAAAAALI